MKDKAEATKSKTITNTWNKPTLTKEKIVSLLSSSHIILDFQNFHLCIKSISIKLN